MFNQKIFIKKHYKLSVEQITDLSSRNYFQTVSELADSSTCCPKKRIFLRKKNINGYIDELKLTNKIT